MIDIRLLDSDPRMRQPSPPSCRLAAALLLACVGCGSLQSNQGDISGGPVPVVAVGGSSGGGRSGDVGAGGGHPDSGGADGPACLPPGASAACSSCEATTCVGNAFIYGEGFDAATYDPNVDPGGPGLGVDWYDDCYNATGTATGGPMQGAKNSDLCAGVVTCIHDSGCNAADPNFPCYCGVGANGTDCVAPGFTPSGPCKDVIAWGMYS